MGNEDAGNRGVSNSSCTNPFVSQKDPMLSETALGMLRGAIDTHIHSAPDTVPRSLDDLELARAAKAAGMRAIVLKNHNAPTAHRAYIAEAAVGGGVSVIGGVVLNGAVGGLNPEAVEAALASGGRIVWMPTVSADNEVVTARWTGTETSPSRHPSELRTSSHRISLRAAETREPLDEILEMVRDAEAVIATGHLSLPDIDILIDRAEHVGVRRIVVTHPESPSIAMSIREQQRYAARGVLFERCFVLVTHPGNLYTTADAVAAIRAVGVESTIVASDLGQPDNPPPVHGFGRYLEMLTRDGLSASELRTVACDNAARLLDL